MAIETELKLQTTPDARDALMAHPLLSGLNAKHQWLQNTYYDTPEARLNALKMALRLRVTDHEIVQTLKTAGRETGGISQRGEWEWVRPAPELNTKVLNDLEAVELDQATLDALEPVFTTDFTRTSWALEYEGVPIEVAFDQGHIEAHGHRCSICEVELELKRETKDAIGVLARLATALSEVTPLRPANASKAARAGRLAANHWPLPSLPSSDDCGQFDTLTAALDAFSDSDDPAHLSRAVKSADVLATSDEPSVADAGRTLSRALRDGSPLTHEASLAGLALLTHCYGN
ncbi:inorganic triphosphatase [Larsenimonas salina]|uniref:CYTH domain-containing protein n=1 Tax=Larsenimonas salina TaxID=1295565 RepID=UPI0020741CA3|nr:CYTH domain-containing protein [Larsenimonas salina]